MSKRMMTSMAGLLGMFALTLGSAAPAGASVLDGLMTVYEGPLQTGSSATVATISHAECVALSTNLTGWLSVDNDSDHVIEFFADEECLVPVGTDSSGNFTSPARAYKVIG